MRQSSQYGYGSQLSGRMEINDIPFLPFPQHTHIHIESELHQNLLLKVSHFRKRSSDRIKNRPEDTPFDKGTW